jgi:hypothetical protein
VSCSVGGGVEGLHLDTADTLALDGSDLDVSSISPGGGPGVSNDVVLLSSLGSVSDGSDGVVEAGSASSGVKDTTGVELEDRLVSLNCDGNDLLVDGSLELGDAVGWNLLVSSNLDLTEGLLLGVARSGNTLSRGVWVLGLEGLTVRLEELEGMALPSTVATVGGVVAGDDFLLGKGEEGSGSKEVGSLGNSGGTESPA